MPTNTLTAAQLKGAGIFNGFVIPATGGGSFVNEYSMTFDGLTDSFNCGSFSDYDNGDLSVSIWIKKTTMGTFESAIRNTGSSSVAGFSIIFENQFRRVAVARRTRTSDTATAYLDIGFTLDTWHNIAFTYKDSTRTLKVYRDGILQSTTIGSASTNTASTNLHIGSFNATSNFLNGYMDEVSIFNSELSSTDISTIYNGGAPADLTSLSPLSWWRMGDGDTWDGSSWILADNGSGGNDATSVSMPEEARLPISPNSYSLNSFVFDGTDFVTMGNPTDLQITGAITLSAWVKTSYSADVQVIIGKDGINTGQRSYLLNIGTSGIPAFYIFTSSGQKNVQGLTTINDGNWHHIMAVNDGTDLTIYIDGTLNNTTVGGGDTMLNGVIDFNIGRRQATSVNADYFVGNIDEVYVWDNDQSGNISTIYGNGVPTDISSLNPLGHWRFGETDVFTTSWTFVDQGSGGNDGTSTTFPESAKTGDQPYVI